MADTIIRASSLPGYPDCPLRWAATTMRKEIEGLGWELRDLPQNIGAANGTAVHSAAAHTLTEKMETGELGKVDDAVEIGVTSIQSQAKQLDISWDATTPEMNVAQQQVIRQTRLYHDKVAPTIKPIAVEEHLKAEIEDGFVLSGHVDVTEAVRSARFEDGEKPEGQSEPNTGLTRCYAARMAAMPTSWSKTTSAASRSARFSRTPSTSSTTARGRRGRRWRRSRRSSPT